MPVPAASCIRYARTRSIRYDSSSSIRYDSSSSIRYGSTGQRYRSHPIADPTLVPLIPPWHALSQYRTAYSRAYLSTGHGIGRRMLPAGRSVAPSDHPVSTIQHASVPASYRATSTGRMCQYQPAIVHHKQY
eukprot:546380-Rhodomonas_salina.4